MLCFEELNRILHKSYLVLFNSFTVRCIYLNFSSEKMVSHPGWEAANPDVQFRSVTKWP